MLENAPYPMQVQDRISLILAGIQEDTWANHLAAQTYRSVHELVDRARMLDTRRAINQQATQRKEAPTTHSLSMSHVSPQFHLPLGHEFI